jgi:hypothetical protein
MSRRVSDRRLLRLMTTMPTPALVALASQQHQSMTRPLNVGFKSESRSNIHRGERKRCAKFGSGLFRDQVRGIALAMGSCKNCVQGLAKRL